VTNHSGPLAVLDRFHPAIGSWFANQFPDGPTAPQAASWPLIATGGDVLVASPTGTGKTLTGFLVAIDAALRRAGEIGCEPRRPLVLYISPLRALAADIHHNLQLPLAGIRREGARIGCRLPELSVAVRTSDTRSAQRVAMRKSPPDLLVTTPESLYLLLTAESSRAMLGGVRTVIVDEVHALARDKRGAHLGLSLERLAHVVESEGGRLQRIGLSATQRPLEVVARLLAGSGPDRPLPAVVDCGHRREMDVAIALPDAELEAVMPHEQFLQVMDLIADQVRSHRTTLVFVNTRKLSERVAHLLSERLADLGAGQVEGGQAVSEDVDRGTRPPPSRCPGDPGPVVAAHHGSLSAERRRWVEARLRDGSLRALVATASLELGIDVGPVDLVCQIGSPRAIGTFLQRVGRANHRRDGTPVGRLYPLTRDELVECTALLAALRRGELDAVRPVSCPLDVLAQQIVAEVAAAGEWEEAALFSLVRRAASFADLRREDFDAVVDLVSSGIPTGRGRRGMHLHRDGVNGRLRPRRGARLAALTNGGAIPETAEYRVVLDPEGTTVGSVHEDFAVEASIGDVFLLGTHSWRVKRVEVGTVRVDDAGNAPPTVPFWLGEAPARTPELSEAVSGLRAAVERALLDAGVDAARTVVGEFAGVTGEAADQLVTYLAEGRAALGVMPTHHDVVVERFFDETEGSQLVIHAPFGGAVNRALALALRKRFCVNFDFELQAAADDDTVTLALGPQHSFGLGAVLRMLSSKSVHEVLVQAVLAHPMFASRWRWNCSRALIVPRSRGGHRRPIHLQRLEADDVLAATWPSLVACRENAPAGPIEVPDHVLVEQTIRDCLKEALDTAGLVQFLEGVENGRIRVHLVESSHPSPFAHGILSARPYTFLDGAPLEERRSRSVKLRRGAAGSDGSSGLPVAVAELAPLERGAVNEVLDQVRPNPRDADELHELLLSLVACRPVPEWEALFEELRRDGRSGVVEGSWVATERLGVAAAFATDDSAAADCIAGHLERLGPVRESDLVSEAALNGGPLRGAPLPPGRARTALARLVSQGFAIALPDGRWCARHLLVRLHAASRDRRRHRSEPATLAQFVQFLTRWQHAAPGSQLEGRSGLMAIIDQLAGIEVPASEWESHVLPARLKCYEPRWLDELCLAGEVAWCRLTPRGERVDPARGGDGDLALARRGSSTPSPATPLAIVPRESLGLLLAAVRNEAVPSAPAAGPAAEVLEVLRASGARFRSELPSLTGRLPTEVDEGLWDLVTRGLVTADAFAAVRSLLAGRRRRAGQHRRTTLGRHRAPIGSGVGEGRWALLPLGPEQSGPASGPGAPDHVADRVAWQLLVRWGVVSWELWNRESFRLPWREVLRGLRRLEARGTALGGRFVAGLSGEQYGLPEAVALLTSVRKRPPSDEEVHVAASDPLNLTGTVLVGPRIPAIRHRSVAYRDGLLVGG